MLVLPSVVLARSSLESLREYALTVYKRLLHVITVPASAHSADLFGLSYEQISQAEQEQASVIARIDASIESIGEDDIFLLPPLFLRCNDDAILQFSESIVLVFSASSNSIIPVFVKTVDTSPSSELIPLLVKMYSVMSVNFATVDNFSTLLESGGSL